MVVIAKHVGVFVPFEEVAGRFRRRRDLPIFTELEEVVNYIQSHKIELARSKIQWQQHSGQEYLAEYRDKIWLGENP